MANPDDPSPMKRFTETEKWRDAWFRKLTPTQKCFWAYLVDNCDAAGVIDIDWDLATFQIGAKVKPADLAAFDRQVVQLPSGKFWVRTFVRFQYGRLSPDCKPHASVFAALARHGISPDGTLIEDGVNSDALPKGMQRVSLPYRESTVASQRVPQTLQDQDKDKDKDKEEDKEKEQDKEGLPPAVDQAPLPTEPGEPDPAPPPPPPPTIITAEQVYDAYPRKQARADALKAISRAVARCPLPRLLVATQAYAKAVALWSEADRQYVPHPATWFNRGSFEDDPATWIRTTPSGDTNPKHKAGFA